MATPRRRSPTSRLILLSALIIAGVGTYKTVTSILDGSISEDTVTVLLLTGAAWLVFWLLARRSIRRWRA